jgi:Zn-dependent protease with chaperone function
MYSLFGSPAAALGLAVSIIALSFFSKWREECADKVGFSICSKAAQQAAPILFYKVKLAQVIYRNNPEVSYFTRLMRKLLFTEDGESRLDILHPSLEDRANYLRLQNV